VINAVISHKPVFLDYPSRSKCATIIYFRGCEHNCEGCQNPEFQSYLDDEAIDKDDFLEELELVMQLNRTDNLVLSGGDPLFQTNVDATRSILTYSIYNVFNTCIYTGYDKEYVDTLKLPFYNYLVTGKFEINNRVTYNEEMFNWFTLASKNQILWDASGNQLTTDGIINEV
jgi:uncharacterized Fe-S radical SAM superfamily protein PflX